MSTSYGLKNVLLQRELEILHAYSSTMTPSAVVIRKGGSKGSRLAVGPQEIRHLVAQMTTPMPRQSHRDVGDELAAFRVVDINGANDIVGPDQRAGGCASFLEPPLRILFVDALRLKRVGRPAPRAPIFSARRFGRHSGSKSGDGG